MQRKPEQKPENGQSTN